jgi:hypothetical protein
MAQKPPEDPEVVLMRPGEDGRDGQAKGDESVQHPAKVMRIGAMVRQLLEEVRHSSLDEASRTRLREIYETSVKELAEVLSPELRKELERLSSPFDEGAPSEAELRIAHAQLVGWLEGLFHGIQAMLFAQEMESRTQLEELRRRGLPAPQGPEEGRRGTYL